ncbi:MAG: helix-hairpin-helix domain-containing protein [Bacteroidales bacterium]|nr:helix-hairpin-helix domain-containing protein [Bacteroidales bacterium]
MNRLLITFLLLLIFSNIFSQIVDNKDNSWSDFVNEIAESTSNEQNINNLYEELSQIHENPFNINQIDRNQLERLPFLSEEQIENIQAYLYVNGPMKSIFELKLVKDLDMKTIEMLLPFVYLGEPPVSEQKIAWQKLFRKAKQTTYFRFDSNLNEKVGFSPKVDSADSRYLGTAPYSFFKYDFNAGNKIQFGFVAEKDAGERIKDGFFSFHFLMKDVGIVKRLALGRYKLAFGQGLAMNTNFAMSKSILASNVATRAEGVSRHFSTDEINYLQGAAITLGYRKHLFSFFVSAKNAAASINDSVLSSIKTDAYFNTENDLKQRNGVMMYLAGTNWQHRFGALKLGATAVYYAFDKPLKPEIRKDNYFSFRGRDNWNVSIDYQYRWRRFFAFGETAMSVNGALASLNGLSVNVSSTFKTTLLQRSYSKSYQAYYSASFAESSRTENEQGVYWGIQWNPYRYWRLSGYADAFRFPWLKYGVDAPSDGYDVMSQLDFYPKEWLKMYFRYKVKQKEKNLTDPDAIVYVVGKYDLQRFRYQCDFSTGDRISFRTGIDYNVYNEERKNGTDGFALSQSISKSFTKLPLEFDAQILLFDTQSYDNVIYSSEKNVLYVFSFPSFSGKGYRYSINLKYDLNSKLSFWLKYAETNYSNREIISSGLEEIKGHSKSDLYFLMRWKM